MSSRRFLFVVGALTLPPQIAVGTEFGDRCVDLATVRAAAVGQSGRLIELTSDQWQFLRGVYAMNPEAPPGLPDGDNAVLAQGRGDSNGQLFLCRRRQGLHTGGCAARAALAYGAGSDGPEKS